MTLRESFGELDQFPTETEVRAAARRRSVEARRLRFRQYPRRCLAALSAICLAIGRTIVLAALWIAVRCGRLLLSLLIALWAHAPRKVPWPTALRPRHSVMALTLVSFGSGLLVGSSIRWPGGSRPEVEAAVAARQALEVSSGTSAPVVLERTTSQDVPVSTTLRDPSTTASQQEAPVTVVPSAPRAASTPKGATALAPAVTRTTKPRAPGFRGTLVVNSRPSGAQVFLNGRSAGTTPLVLNNQPAGSRAVRLSLDGYASWTSVVQIVAGRQVRLNTALKAETGP